MFLIVSHGPLVHTLAAVILKSDGNVITNGASKILEDYTDERVSKSIGFSPPKESLEKSLDSLSEPRTESDDQPESETANGEVSRTAETVNADEVAANSDEPGTSANVNGEDSTARPSIEQLHISIPNETGDKVEHLNVTDEEKEQRLALESPLAAQQPSNKAVKISTTNKPFLETILNSLHCTENDYATLFALCLLYALASNQVIVHLYIN